MYEYAGYIKDISKNYKGENIITFATDYNIEGLAQENGALTLTIKKYRKKRSLDANGLLWHCIGVIAKELGADKWQVYLQMLRRYGEFTYICVKPSAVEATQRQWRESEVIGEVDINGRKAIQLLCYYGSSTYDTKEFSVLLDNVISEMKEMGLPAPQDADMERALELWAKNYGKQ